MRFTKEKQEQLRAAKEKKGKKVIQEERRAHRAVRGKYFFDLAGPTRFGS